MPTDTRYNRDEILRRAEMAAVLVTADRLELHCDDGDTWVAVITSSGPDLPPLAVRGEGRTPERALVSMADAIIQEAYAWADDPKHPSAPAHPAAGGCASGARG